MAFSLGLCMCVWISGRVCECVCVWFGLFDRVKKEGEAVKPIEEEAKEWCFFLFLSFLLSLHQVSIDVSK